MGCACLAACWPAGPSLPCLQLPVPTAATLHQASSVLCQPIPAACTPRLPPSLPACVAGRAVDLQGAGIEVPMIVNGQPQYRLVLQEGINKHVFGEGLSPVEQEWLVEVINEHVGE